MAARQKKVADENYSNVSIWNAHVLEIIEKKMYAFQSHPNIVWIV